MQHTSVAEWLASLGLAQYAPAFTEHRIDSETLDGLSEDDLKELGVAAMGDRRKMMRAIAARTATAAMVEPANVGSAPNTASAVRAETASRPSGAERRHLTVMFCDLVGSTAIAARLDPEDMREVVRAYQGACAQVIARYDGFVAQYLGDGIMAYFGYPAAHEDDAERAVRAGLDLVAAAAKLEIATKVEVRIGIATGLVVVGDLIGEQGAKERAVTGESPNLAARLQGLAAPGSIVVGPTTRRLLGGQFEIRDLGAQQLKGLDAPVTAFAIDGVRTFESRFEARAGGLSGFVGREEECEHLLERWKLARQGRGQVVLVLGEAGIGKSRLTAWLVDKASGEPHTRMRYQCTPHHKDSALYPTIAQLERAAGIEATEPGAAKLAKLEALLTLAETDAAETVPLFAALLSIPTGEKYPPLAMSPGQQRQRTLAALLNQVEALAQQKPLLMIYEDAHWADATSLELLDSLVDRLARLPVLFVVTGRPEFSPAWAGRHNVSTVTLQKLDKRHSRALVESVAGAELPTEVLDQIIAKTDGVPLFVEELTKAVLESGALAEDGRSLKTTTALPIPATLQDSLMARLDRSNPVKEIAQIGAAIGREFSYKLLAAVAGMDEASVRNALTKLEEAELALRRGVPPDATYTFKHALMQDAAYESLLRSRRQSIHRRIAKALRDKFPIMAETEPDIIAHHFTQAGRTKQAIEWWIRAGQRAAKHLAFTEAASVYERAIALADASAADLLTTIDRARLQIFYGQALLVAHGYAAPIASAAFARARELADKLADCPEIFSIYLGLWNGPYFRGEAADLTEITEVCLQRAVKLRAGAEKCLGLRLAGCTCWSRGDIVGALSYFRESLAAFDELRDAKSAFRHGAHVAIMAACCMAQVTWVHGDIRAGQELADRTYRQAVQSKHVVTLALALAVRCIYESIRTNAAGALEIATSLIDLVQEHQLTFWLTVGLMTRGWARWHLGNHRDGDADMKRAEVMRRDQGMRLHAPMFCHMRVDVLMRSDQLHEAATMIDDILIDNERRQQTWLDAEFHRLRARLQLLRLPGNQLASESAYRRSIEVARAQRARTFELRGSLDLARLYCDTAREREAVPLLQGALVGFTETPELPEIGEARRLLASLQ